MLGGLTPMAPKRKKDLATVAVRALIAGTVACFLTACIAGKNDDDDDDDGDGGDDDDDDDDDDGEDGVQHL